MNQPIFASDEMTALKVEQDWTAEELLSQEGIFYLKDIADLLRINVPKLKAHVRQHQEEGKPVWDIMGVKRIWLHWIVRMKVFAPYYRANFLPKDIGRITDHDANTILQQKGLFYLTDVAKLIPFTAQQLRYQANKNPHSKKDMGVWKDPDLNSFLVNMPVFSKWLKTIWLQGASQSDKD